MDPPAIAALRAIAAEALEALQRLRDGDEMGAEERYRGLLHRAAILNAEHQWAPAEDFETLLPTVDARREMDAMDEQYRVGRSPEQEKPPAIEELLTALWGWSRGVLVPYEQGLG